MKRDLIDKFIEDLKVSAEQEQQLRELLLTLHDQGPSPPSDELLGCAPLPLDSFILAENRVPAGATINIDSTYPEELLEEQQPPDAPSSESPDAEYDFDDEEAETFEFLRQIAPASSPAP